MGMVKQDDGWRLPDRLWSQMEPLLPPRKPHPLGCHSPRVSDRAAMDAILFVLRTGCQWNALNGTGICSSSSAHRRFQEWVEAGVFEEFWVHGLLNAVALREIDWSWLSLDGAMTKAPLGGEKSMAALLFATMISDEVFGSRKSIRHIVGDSSRATMRIAPGSSKKTGRRLDAYFSLRVPARPVCRSRHLISTVAKPGGYSSTTLLQFTSLNGRRYLGIKFGMFGS